MTSRYSRQLRFAPIGAEGQDKLASATVLVLGLGALGGHTAAWLARAGVGRLVVVDRDVVEVGNLQRQVLFDEADARDGRPKAIAAAEHLAAANPDCEVVPIADDFTAATWDALDRRPDVAVDGTDNFPTRMLLNDLAVRDGVPWIYGGVVGSSGRAMVVVPGRTPCLRCVVPEPPPAGELGTCETHGVIAPAAAEVAALQTAQALRLVVSDGREFAAGAFACDPWHGTHERTLAAATPDPECASCGTGALPALQSDTPPSVVLCGRDAVQVRPRGGGHVDLARLADALAATTAVERTPHLLRFDAEGCRFSVFAGGRALLQGVRDAERARVLYDRWIGA